MTLDLIALGILAVFGALGAWRGVLASASGLLSLAAGYASAIVFSTAFAPIVAAQLGVAEPIGLVIAGCGSFVVAWLFVSVMFRMLRRMAEERRDGRPRTGLDRTGGAFFGFARGAVIVVLLGWVSLWLDAAKGMALDADAGAETANVSRVADMSGAVVESALEAAFSDSGTSGEVVARLAGRPDRAFGSMRALIENERFRAIQDDSLFWTYVQNDSIENASGPGYRLQSAVPASCGSLHP